MSSVCKSHARSVFSTFVPPKEVPLGLSEVVAANLERIRIKGGLSQEQVAARGSRVGLPWSRSTITALEGGRRTITVAELLLLALALDASVAELLSGRGAATLGDGSEVPLSDIRNLLTGDADSAAIRKRITAARHQKHERAMRAVSGEAEQKAARKLGVTPQTIAEESFIRWGRSLTEERDARVDQEGLRPRSARSLQALRGHITRQLLGEIESVITSNPTLFPEKTDS